MKRIWFITCLLILLMGCGKSAEEEVASSQEQKENLSTQMVENEESALSYTLPKEVNYYGKAQHSDYNAPNFQLVNRFYPIGWSKDGKFAFLEEIALEAAGCYEIHAKIQDMKSDKLLLDYTYEIPEEECDWQNLDEAEERSKFWELDLLKLSENFARAGIIQETDMKLIENNTLEFDEGNLSIKAETKRGFQNFSEKGEISEIRLLVTTEKAGKKVQKKVGEQLFKEFSAILDGSVKGYLKSPHENRIAILYNSLQRGYEGPPHVNLFDLYGSSY